MIKAYVKMDNNYENVLVYSTDRLDFISLEVYHENPLIDVSKLCGYKVIIGVGINELVFDEEKYKRCIEEKTRQEEIEKANEKFDELAQETVLDNASDEDAYTMRYLYPSWEVGIEYKKDNRIMYEDKFFKVLQDHTSQADWLPTEATSLYVEISDPSVEYPQWKQPTSSADAYMKGDKVTYEEVKYISLVDNNVWNPKDYPQGWEEVVDNG